MDRVFPDRIYVYINSRRKTNFRNLRHGPITRRAKDIHHISGFKWREKISIRTNFFNSAGRMVKYERLN